MDIFKIRWNQLRQMILDFPLGMYNVPLNCPSKAVLSSAHRYGYQTVVFNASQKPVWCEPWQFYSFLDVLRRAVNQRMTGYIGGIHICRVSSIREALPLMRTAHRSKCGFAPVAPADEMMDVQDREFDNDCPPSIHSDYWQYYSLGMAWVCRVW